MRLILAIFVPWLPFFMIRRPFSGLCCFFLQLSLVGWLPATIWSVFARSHYEIDLKIKMALSEVEGFNAANNRHSKLSDLIAEK